MVLMPISNFKRNSISWEKRKRIVFRSSCGATWCQTLYRIRRKTATRSSSTRLKDEQEMSLQGYQSTASARKYPHEAAPDGQTPQVTSGKHTLVPCMARWSHNGRRRLVIARALNLMHFLSPYWISISIWIGQNLPMLQRRVNEVDRPC